MFMVKHWMFHEESKFIPILFLLLLLISAVPIYRTVVDIGPGITHQNHEDTITTPLPGNCPDCNYPDCGGCGGQPQITLMPTEVIPTIPAFGGTVVMPATPAIPHPTPCGVSCATVFPTFSVTGLLPTPITTMAVPTIAPTVVPATLPPAPPTVGTGSG